MSTAGADLLPVVESIPASLKAKARWIVAAPDKKPLQADGRPASSTDPATWCSFEDALDAARRMGCGVGYVLDEGMVCIDLDKSILDDGALSQQAAEIVQATRGWTEISRSGRGIHVWMRGRKPAHAGSRRNGVEVYQGPGGRYIAVTGRVLPGYEADDLPQRQAEIEAVCLRLWPAPTPRQPSTRSAIPTPARVENTLDDAELIRRAMAAANGGKLRSLLAGDASCYPSASEADMACACALAFWSRDPSQIERIMRTSALARAKWDEGRQDETWVGLTVRRAMESATAHYGDGTGQSAAPTSAAAPAREVVALPDTPSPHGIAWPDLCLDRIDHLRETARRLLTEKGHSPEPGSWRQLAYRTADQPDSIVHGHDLLDPRLWRVVPEDASADALRAAVVDPAARTIRVGDREIAVSPELYESHFAPAPGAESGTTTPTPARAHMEIVDAHDLIDVPPDPPRSLLDVPGLIDSGEIALITGAPGSLKSIMLVNFAVAVAAGSEFFILRAERRDPLPVLLLLAEYPHYRAYQRLAPVMRHYAPPRGTLHVWHRERSPGYLDLADPLAGRAGEIAEFVRRAGVGLVAIDSLSEIHAADENDRAAMTAVVRGLRRIADAGCAVLCVHHHRKMPNTGGRGKGAGMPALDDVRGSGAIAAAVASVLSCRREAEVEGEEEGPAAIAAWTKSNYANPEHRAIRYRIDPDSPGLIVSMEPFTTGGGRPGLTDEDVLDAVRAGGRQGVDEIAVALGVTGKTVRPHLAALVRAGKLVEGKGARGKLLWEVPPG